MQSAGSFFAVLSFVLCCACVGGIRLRNSVRMGGHHGQPLCRMAPQQTGDDPIIVRIDVEDNFRSLSFGESAGTETAVQCAGQVAETCMPASGDGHPLPDCDALENCDCSLHAQDLPFPGMKALAEKLELMCTASESPLHALMIGLGGGAVSSYLRDRCNGKLQMDNVEKDPRVAHLATQFFGFTQDENSALEVTDGLSAVQSRPLGTYDAVLVDCFAGHDQVPEGCRSEQFLKATKAILKSDGILVQNIWGRSSASDSVGAQFNATLASYSAAFGPDKVFRDVAFDAPQSLEYMLYGLKGDHWSSLMPIE